MTGMKKMDHEYRKSDEYKLFIECLNHYGVHESLHDVAIMSHLADPFLYKKLKKQKDLSNHYPREHSLNTKQWKSKRGIYPPCPPNL